MAKATHSLGGVCTSPLHVTCQRLRFEEPAARDRFCREIRSALRSLKKFAAYGDGLILGYSQFRLCWILKCHSPIAEPLWEVSATVDRVAAQYGASLAYERHEDSTPVTVLENIPAAMAALLRRQNSAVIMPGTRLFDVARATISVLGDPGIFEVIDTWPIT